MSATNQHFSIIAILFLSKRLLHESRFPIKNNNFSSLKFLYYRLANREELILSQGKYFKTLKGVVIDTESIHATF